MHVYVKCITLFTAGTPVHAEFFSVHTGDEDSGGDDNSCLTHFGFTDDKLDLSE